MRESPNVVSVSFALGIPHTPWRPERVESLKRLRASLFDKQNASVGDVEAWPHSLQVFAEREPNWVWSAKMWRWAIETDATHFLTLQDDVIVSPEFWRHLRAMVEAVPDKVIGLESVHPKSAEVTGAWCTTLDCLVGVGYVVPMPLLREFLQWREFLRKGAVESISEDTLLAVWCFVSGHEVWHPVPTIIDHDVELPSTYGNDQHGHRKPVVTWREREVPSDWTPRDVVQLGRFYDATPRLARRWIPSATEEDYQRWLAMR